MPLDVDFGTAIEALRSGLRGKALMDGDAGYDEARSVWNAMIDRRPQVIARCKGVADVIDAVNFARGQGLPISIRGGGHNVAGHATCDGGVMIDLSEMRAVQVTPSTRRAIVEGGALWSDLDRESQAFGLATPGGLISDTGVAGLTLSGGIGWLRSAHGLSIDNLVSADVVTADGQFLKANADENPDLYWALRGGGGNFGVVVSFEFALHPIGPTVMFCAPIYPLSAGPNPIRFWRDFIADKKDRVGSMVEFSTIPEGEDFPEKYWGQRCYTILAVYAGDPDEGESLLKPLRGQGEMVTDFSGQMDYCELQGMFDEMMPAGEFRCYWKSHLLADLSDAAIDEFISNAAASPSENSISSIWSFGGATAKVDAGKTAFGDRSFGWMYSLDSVWPDAADDKRVMDWTRAAWTRARAHAQENRIYLNFAGQDADSDDLTRNAFGGHYPRLAQIKKKYDPSNLFRFNQNIKPEGSA